MTSRQRFGALAVSVLVMATILALACSKTPPAIAPVEAAAEDHRRFAMAFGDVSRASILIEERPFTSSTSRIIIQHTPLFIQIHNEGERELRYRPEDIVLRYGDRDYAAEEVDRVVLNATAGVHEARFAKTKALRPNTLNPGASAEGFVFFRKRLEAEELSEGGLEIVLSFYDSSHKTLIDVVEIPLTPAQ